MSQVPAWFERKFEGGYPVALLPNLLARLRGTPARLEDVLRGRSAEALIAHDDGKWSAQEQAGHLLVMEPLWLARMENFVTGGEQLAVADLQNRKTFEAEFNSRDLAEVLREFREERDKLLARVGELDAGVFTKTLIHPRLKTPMSLADFLVFVAEHDDHHLARIWELLEG